MLRHTILAFISLYGQLAYSSPVISSAGAELETRQHIRGAISLDDVASTCSQDRADIIRRAFKDLTLLTDAVQGIKGDDPSFVQFFGVGWSGGKYGNYYSYVAKNLDLAKQLTLDRESNTKVSVTCKDVRNRCNNVGFAAYTTVHHDSSLQTMVFCPLYFTAGLFHLTDRAKGKPTQNLASLKSYEHVALHELMHVDSAGYQTAVDSSDLFANSGNSNHIGDLEAKVASFDDTRYKIYGINLCERYAKYKSPPKSATANADSYVWLASGKYFSKTWNTPVSREEGGSNPADAPDSDQVFVDPEYTCDARGQPLRTDCQQISIPDNYDALNLDGGACYTNGNRKWCDMYTFGSCQVTVGWDTSANGGKQPVLKNHDLKSKLEGNFGRGQCSPYTEDVPGACVRPQGTPCVTPYRLCIKRVGYECKP